MVVTGLLLIALALLPQITSNSRKKIFNNLI